MTARAGWKRAGAGSTIVIAVVLVAALWLVGAPPAAAATLEVAERGRAAEPVAEVDTASSVAPSSAAGLSLFGAAVAASLWGVAVGERRLKRASRR